MTPGGTLARDGRIQPGDYLVSVNEEAMRTISHSQALDILRRTHMVPLGQGRFLTKTRQCQGILQNVAKPKRWREGDY